MQSDLKLVPGRTARETAEEFSQIEAELVAYAIEIHGHYVNNAPVDTIARVVKAIIELGGRARTVMGLISQTHIAERTQNPAQKGN